MTHPFHPLAGREIALFDRRAGGGEQRVYFENDAGEMAWLPAAWTTVAGDDPLIVMAAGRAYFRVDDLVRLAALLAGLEA